MPYVDVAIDLHCWSYLFALVPAPLIPKQIFRANRRLTSEHCAAIPSAIIRTRPPIHYPCITIIGMAAVSEGNLEWAPLSKEEQDAVTGCMKSLDAAPLHAQSDSEVDLRGLDGVVNEFVKHFAPWTKVYLYSSRYYGTPANLSNPAQQPTFEGHSSPNLQTYDPSCTQQSTPDSYRNYLQHPHYWQAASDYWILYLPH